MAKSAKVNTVLPAIAPAPKAEISPLMMWCFWMDSNLDLSAAQEVLARHVERVIDNPAYALEWAGEAFQAAADIKVRGMLLGLVSEASVKGISVAEQIRYTQEVALKETIRHARMPNRSTSACSNEMAACTGKAWAEVAERIEWLVKHHA